MAFAILGLVGLTGGALAPDLGSDAAREAVAQQASLTRHGTDLTITGSIGDIFLSGSFVGPNRSEKQDRARPEEDLMALTRKFDAIRSRIAELRQPKIPSIIPVVKMNEPAVASTAPAAALPGTPLAVASLNEASGADALAAIDALAANGAPMPRQMPEKLAYARADLPATVFDGSVNDKKGKRVSDKEIWCMATAIYFEARGESYRGQVAVGQVVMNRKAHKLYPDTICGVVFQNEHKRNACQFSFACDGIPERVTDQKAWKQADQIARDVISGKEYLTEVGYATHYHATYVYPHWAPRMTKVTKIGLHVFYHFKRGWKFG